VPSHASEADLSFAKTNFVLFLLVIRRVIVGAAGGAAARLINILLCRVVCSKT
jgi:hypothetical protein